MKFYRGRSKLFKNLLLIRTKLYPLCLWSKSSGKITVMLRVIEELSEKDIIFFYYDLRKYATPTKGVIRNIFRKR